MGTGRFSDSNNVMRSLDEWEQLPPKLPDMCMPFDHRYEYSFYKLKGYSLELGLASASSACLELVFNLPKAEGIICLSDGSI